MYSMPDGTTELTPVFCNYCYMFNYCNYRGQSRKPKLQNSSPNSSVASKNIPQNGSPSRLMVYFCFRLCPLPCSYATTPRAIVGTQHPQWLPPPLHMYSFTKHAHF